MIIFKNKKINTNDVTPYNHKALFDKHLIKNYLNTERTNLSKKCIT